MISLEDLKRIGRLKGLYNIGYAEKDYIMDIILLSISRSTKDELVFKGGTCLYKFYGLHRFSEDIDFTMKKDININSLLKKIISNLSYFGIDAEIKSDKREYNTIMIVIRAKGPLYKGTNQSSTTIGIDINTKSEINRKPVLMDYSSVYPDIPSFPLFVMDENEILAEKARAVMSREKARDVYDIWFLLKKGLLFDENLANEKLRYYGKVWDYKEFVSKIDQKEGLWNLELRSLIRDFPGFKDARSFILEKMKKQT